MPLEWMVDEPAKCLVGHWTEGITWQEIEHFQDTVTFPHQARGYHSLLVIAASARFPTGSAEGPMRLIAARAAVQNHVSRPTCLAIVTHSEIAFGLARMFLTFKELAGGTRPVGLFQQEDEARAWLADAASPRAESA